MSLKENLKGGLFYLLLSVTLVPAALIVMAAALFSRKNAFDLARLWARFILVLAGSVCGLKWREIGFENFPTDGTPVLVLSKHQSAWETFWMFARVPHRVSFVYKKELHLVPLFGQALASLGMMAINRKKGQSAFEYFRTKGAEFIQKGWWIVLFPEGTRTAPGSVGKYKTGGARFAVSKGVPIVPVALNSGDFWPKNSIGKKAGTITVSIGPKIETAGKTFEEVQERMTAWIENEMLRISPASYRRS